MTAIEVGFYWEVNFGSQPETYDVETDVTSGMATITWTMLMQPNTRHYCKKGEFLPEIKEQDRGKVY